jgi:hypothetical protein
VAEVLGNPVYKKNVDMLSREFDQYEPEEIFESYVAELTGRKQLPGSVSALETPMDQQILKSAS